MTEKNTSPIVEQGLKALHDIAIESVQHIAPYTEKADMENYRNFCNMMYHYSLEGEPQLERAADASPTKDLKEFNSFLAKDEAGHHMLALKDLEALGYGIAEKSPPEVAEYHAYWNEFTSEKAYEYLGATVVVENTVANLEQGAAALMRRLNLTKTQSRWLGIHCELDQEHGALSIDCAARHLNPDTIDLMIDGAKRDNALWIAMLQAGFAGRVTLPKRY